MKRKSSIILIYATVSAIATGSAAAAPEEKPARIEKRIELRTGEPGASAKPDRPAEPVTFLGLEVAPVDEALAAQLKLPPDHGLVVRFVVPDSPAAAAGLLKNDVLVRLDDQLLIAQRQLSALVRSRKEGDSVQLTYLRAGAEARARATLGKRVPPRAQIPHAFGWSGAAAEGFPLPTQSHVVFSSDGAGSEGHRAVTISRNSGGPHMMIYRPQARIVYSEGDVTLEVTVDDKGRQLEARGADGTVTFSGPINSPEERAAVPENLKAHLEKLDALEPSGIDFTAPHSAPHAIPHPLPAPTTSSGAALLRSLHSDDEERDVLIGLVHQAAI